MKEKIKLFFRKIRKNVIEYIATNRLFLTYVIIAMAGLMLARNFTIGNMWPKFDSCYLKISRKARKNLVFYLFYN